MQAKEKLFGSHVSRIDGVAKVTGAARYASDERVANPAFAYFVTSRIARGRIGAFKLEHAKAVAGVLDILTHENVGDQIKPAVGPDGGPTTTTLENDRIWHAGQIIAIVLADAYEAAREAANKVEVVYIPEPASGSFDSQGTATEPHKPQKGPDPNKGDAAAAFAAAAVRFEARYTTPTQHHNAIELFTATCVWDGPKLTIYEPSQFMWGTKNGVAKQLNVDPEQVRAISRYIGGAFGSKGPNPRTAWIALAAKRLNRPVKLVPTRDQGFTIATYRAETRQDIKLGATSEGKLTAFLHEGWEVTSRPSGYNVAGVESTARMYACPNIATAVNVVHADRSTPGYMRAPPETPYMFALESAMDELAYELKMDPIELRRINDTQTDPVNGLPFSSRSLMQCFDQAAAQFGWRNRNPLPGSMSDGDWLVGFGCATACYPSNMGPAAARVSLTADGKAIVGIAGHEIGTGAYTVVAITAARSLGLKVADVTVHMGDSELPPLMIAGGSNNAASAANVVAKACEELRQRIAKAAILAADSPFRGADPDTLHLSDGRLSDAAGRSEPLSSAVSRAGHRLEVYTENVPQGLPAGSVASMAKGKPTMLGGAGRKDVAAFAFGAHFVEVRVHSRTREIRVPRVVSAFAAGTIVNPKTAHSQFMSGAIWGLSSALLEETVLDSGSARYVNNNLADYLIPVNADVPSVEIIMVAENDERVNPLGIKGIGEIGIVGMNAAVANAVFHATGKRIRDLPIRAEKLL
ncbi:MAG TPA: xanthine dehydrogenase family protein molybdopterin-binding subunit [Steroidobacteraceae bacterium]|nr:xanthine dehydrogenase family protein molybdopterin-binding subunit [Steroidobacteraceae bacterium]